MRNPEAAIVEDLEEIAALGVGDPGHREAVDHEDVGARDLRGEHARVASVGACQRELGEEPCRAARR